ncbi:hypothetical protein MANES_12G004650v8 [Manihot esculenta]|uniref:Uncharacterized protein n=1 Tax=Manihot esculenta TaxID=3983 RepID=A0ACB7GSB7_MANES|nr:hypothetical protein MANES_12G004650v8 [Manihot esculenta]
MPVHRLTTSAICSGLTVSVSIKLSSVLPSSRAMAASTSSNAPYRKSATPAKSYLLSASCTANCISSFFCLRRPISSILSFSFLYSILRG